MLEMREQVRRIMPTALTGRVVRIIGTTAAVAGLPAPIGAMVEIDRASGRGLRTEVIGFRDDLTIVYPQSDLNGVRRGNQVRLVRTLPWISVGSELLGRVVNAEGRASMVDHSPCSRIARQSISVRPTPSTVRASTRRYPPASAPWMPCSPAARGSEWVFSPVPASARA